MGHIRASICVYADGSLPGIWSRYIMMAHPTWEAADIAGCKVAR